MRYQTYHISSIILGDSTENLDVESKRKVLHPTETTADRYRQMTVTDSLVLKLRAKDWKSGVQRHLSDSSSKRRLSPLLMGTCSKCLQVQTILHWAYTQQCWTMLSVLTVPHTSWRADFSRFSGDNWSNHSNFGEQTSLLLHRGILVWANEGGGPPNKEQAHEGSVYNREGAILLLCEAPQKQLHVIDPKKWWTHTRKRRTDNSSFVPV